MDEQNTTPQSNESVVPTPPSPAPTYKGGQMMIGVGDLFKNSFEFYKRHLSNILVLMLIPLVYNLAVVFLIGRVQGVIYTVLLVLLGIGMFLSYIAFMQYIARDGQGSVGEMFSTSLKYILPLIWVQLLVGFVVFGGFILFVVPGIIFSIYLGVVIWALFSEGRRGMNALVTSWHYVRGHGWAVFGRQLVLGLFAVVFTLIFSGGTIFAEINSAPGTYVPGVGYAVNAFASNLFLTPFAIIYGYLMYKSLRSIKGAIGLESEEAKKTRKLLVGFAIFAPLAIFLLVLFGGFATLILGALNSGNSASVIQSFFSF